MNDSELREIPFEKETIFEGHILHVEKWQVTCPNGHTAPPAPRERRPRDAGNPGGQA